MSAKADQQQISGQGPRRRRDPCFTAPVFFTLSMLFLAAAAVCAVLGFAPYSPPRLLAAPAAAALVAVFGALALVLLVLTFPSVRLFLRIMRPYSSPRTKEAIVAAFSAHDSPVPVGEGWAFFIQKQKPAGRALALGPGWRRVVKTSGTESGGVRVQVGMRMGELTRVLFQRGEALHDRPQFDQLSVGGAVRTAAHGWGTRAWWLDGVARLEAVERGTGRVLEVGRGDPAFLEVALSPRYTLLEAEITGRPNALVRVVKRTFPAPAAGEAPAVEHLDPVAFVASDFAILFVYGDRCVTYAGTPADPSAPEVRLTSADLRGRYYARVLGCPCGADTDEVDTVADAHTIIETVWPFEVVVARLADQANMELFSPGPLDLARAPGVLARFHALRGGRTDIRFRVAPGGTLWSVCVSVRAGPRDGGPGTTPRHLREWLQAVHSLGVSRGAPHPGKVVPPDLGPVQGVPLQGLWEEVLAWDGP